MKGGPNVPLKPGHAPLGTPSTAREGGVVKEERFLVGVPREMFPGQTRVALVPGVMPGLAKAGMDVMVEESQGEAAGFSDAAYVQVIGEVVDELSKLPTKEVALR